MQHLLNESKRVEWVDYLKGLAIFLVVLGHSYTPYTHIDSVSWAFNSIYAFHMPLFFVLSGVTAAMSMISRDRVGRFALDRLMSIMIPYLCWSLLRPLFFAESSTWAHYSIEAQFLSFASGGDAIWFLPALFLLQLYYCAFYLLTRRVGSAVVQVGLLGVLFTLSFALHRLGGKTSDASVFSFQWLTSAYNYFPSFFFGVMLVHYKKVYELASQNRYVITLALLVLFFVLSLFGLLPYPQYVKSLCGVCAAIVLMRFMIQWRAPSWAKGQLRLLGQYSLIIYLASSMFEARGLNLFLEGMNATFVQLAYGLASLVVCYACIVFAKFIELSSILSFFLLGKRLKVSSK